MDYIYQNVEVFQRWLVITGVMTGLAIAGDAIIHIAVKKIKEFINGRR